MPTGRPDWTTVVQSAEAIDALRRTVDEANAQAESLNETILDALETATERKLQRTPRAWWDWWLAHNELQTERDKPAYEQRTVSVSLREIPPPACMCCLLPGTLVATNTGPLSIEKVRPGDCVLGQDPNTGELAYRPVIGALMRPASPTLRIGVGGEEIAATRGHPLWVAGEGWVMAKELLKGDLLHGVRGAVPIDYIEPGPESIAYNLVVADFHNFVVGKQLVLTHDNTIRRPTSARVPGLLAH
jgi:hypothetical protein